MSEDDNKRLQNYPAWKVLINLKFTGIWPIKEQCCQGMWLIVAKVTSEVLSSGIAGRNSNLIGRNGTGCPTWIVK